MAPEPASKNEQKSVKPKVKLQEKDDSFDWDFSEEEQPTVIASPNRQ